MTIATFDGASARKTAPAFGAQPGSIPWLAKHEFRLAWRDWRYLITAGKASRARKVAIALVIAAFVAHLFAWFVLHRLSADDFPVVRAGYLLLTGGLALKFCLMISQAMEASTRVLYARSDLDLFHSSPARLARVFLVRLAIIGSMVSAMGILIASPFINVAAWLHGAFWLSAYGVVIAMGMIAAAIAIVMTGALFRTIGPRRTRTAAQLTAAIVGALFVIGLQIVGIFTAGTLSQVKVLQASSLVAQMPMDDSALWWPARAAMGEAPLLALVLAIAITLFSLVVWIGSKRFVGFSLDAVNAGDLLDNGQRTHAKFRWSNSNQALRRKEWALMLRDPWLISQTGMQLLYLLPPALLLWNTYGRGANVLAITIPVLVMASGQLAGGLAWLAISGEDAPDLVATAPIKARAITKAKVESVMGAVLTVIAPFVIVYATVSLRYAAVLFATVALSAGSSTLIQLWFKAQARRAQFHRRQTSSRIATFAEAFSSIGWAGAGGLIAGGLWSAGAVAVGLTLVVLLITRQLAPRHG